MSVALVEEPVQRSSATGEVSRAGLATQATPGSTLSYPFWYRDVANSCAGGGFNVSIGWAVTW